VSVVGNCPSCGAQVTFAIGSSAVVVCGQCNSVVARTDRGFEDHGKVAALIDTGSPLRVGVSGNYRGAPYRITGRTQLRHQAGGVWDEWYAAFDNGAWGWLAEAQGRFYVTFKVEAAAPPLATLQVGAPAVWQGFVVAEIGQAELASAEGELPWRPQPGYSYAYADLSGANRAFGTVDYSEEPPAVFHGQEVTLADLGVAHEERTAGRTRLTTLNCTQCGGALDLKAPDQAERIWCPYCGSGHDVTQGKLQFFRKLKKQGVQPVIPLGSSGTIDGDAYVVAGFMQRAVRFDRDYFWTEYLLYNPEKSYRWLVHSDGHWSFVTPLRPGDVQDADPRGASTAVEYEGRRYRLFQTATARVTHVVGEFYWRVEVGEQANTSDYIAPPFGISKELTRSGAQEIAYSHGRYMTPGEVEQAFGVENLGRPSGIGPMQPNPAGSLVKPWLLMIALLIAATIFLAVTLPKRLVHERTYDLNTAAVAQGAPENARVLFSEPFELSGRHNVQVRAEAGPLDNTWIHLGVDLVSERSDQVITFEMPLEYYHGTDGGERWSEGDNDDSKYLSRPEAGPYVLRVEAQWEPGKPPPLVRLRVREGVFRIVYLILALIGISVFPVISLLRKVSFESRRWQESAFNPFTGAPAGEDDEEDE
jgi:DNA-directed RNA polymerase subunit RPC12/RpoP